MVLIGSRALALRSPHLLHRKPLDFDFVCTRAEYDAWLEKNAHKVNPTKIYAEGARKQIVEGDTNCEFELVSPGTSAELLTDLAQKDAVETPFGLVPSLDLLFTLKASHRYLKNSPYFWKTAEDYHTTKRAGAQAIPELLSLREKETYTYAHPKLNQSKSTFFADDSVPYVYDHDDIHKSITRLPQPAYRYYMKEGEQVQCSKEKFFALPESIRLAGVVEEAAVLAVERSLVPHPGAKTPKEAWLYALMKVCSSITSGWFRAYGYDNLPTIVRMYPEGYWEKFELDVQGGKVGAFDGERYK